MTLRVGLVYDDTIDRFGGIGLYVTTLGRELQRRGHQVTYLLGTSTADEHVGAAVHALARNVTVHFNGNVLSMPAWSDGRRLSRVLRRGAFDVLHVQVPYSPLMAGRLLTRADPRCAVVGTYHVASERFLPRAGARALRALKARSAPRMDALISVSAVAARFAARWSGMETSVVLPNMLDARRLRAQAAAAPRAIEADVVFVGRLVPRKGAEHLIRAAAGLPGGTRVAILGDGPLRPQLERLAHRLGVAASVSFHGAVTDDIKAASLAQAGVACFPSVYGESFGVVILEALAAGADMVLAGDNPGYAEVLGDRRALVDPCDTWALAERLRSLLRQPLLRASIGTGQRRLVDRCDAERVTSSIVDVYTAALMHRRGRELIRAVA